MSSTPPTQRTVQPEDWFTAYFIGVTALAVVVSAGLMLMMLAGAGTVRWTEIFQVLFMGLLTLMASGLVIGILTALPCTLFFWLAHRFAWRNVLIYLFCGILGSLPTMPVVASMFPSSFFTDPPEVESKAGELEDYLAMVPLFTGSGAFLGAMFWWRTGRHLRRASA
ncbi:hypothetical protein [Pseudomonas piscis]|uniref:hypothetical protein n=1 Tax=Pseudomonas piscis TaxID=2614538 RepID=UPI0021D5B864|nr:hypothetical protein [Pseudomonas piscis]MCU7649025.1 hypothetical protein [Pseudomonas piscis]